MVDVKRLSLDTRDRCSPTPGSIMQLIILAVSLWLQRAILFPRTFDNRFSEHVPVFIVPGLAFHGSTTHDAYSLWVFTMHEMEARKRYFKDLAVRTTIVCCTIHDAQCLAHSFLSIVPVRARRRSCKTAHFLARLDMLGPQSW